MKNDKNILLKNALTVSMGGFIAKVLGAVYRIPLTNILGSEGMGLYQMVFPLYCVLLTISSTGLPSSISKIISEGNSAETVLKKSKSFFGLIGFFGTLFMCAFSVFIARLQGNVNAWGGYVALAPAVFFVSLISCLRGYFQGNGNMRPTATSQVVEQVIKLVLGLAFSLMFKENMLLSVTMSVAAVSVSEAVAFIYLSIEKNKFVARNLDENKLFTPVDNDDFAEPISTTNEKITLDGETETTELITPDGEMEAIVDNANDGEIIATVNDVIDGKILLHEKSKNAISIKRLIAVVFPVTLTSILIPLSRVLDSFLSINIISTYSSQATKLYGLYSGGVESIIGVPVSICYGIPVALIPLMSSAFKKGDTKMSKKIAKSAILYTFILSCAFAAGVAVFSSLAVKILYFALDLQSKNTLIGLLKISSISIVFLSCVQTFNAIKISENKLYLPSIFLFVGIAAKVVALLVLLPNPEINIFAVAISDILCYFVACFCNLGYYITENIRRKRKIVPLKTKIETL